MPRFFDKQSKLASFSRQVNGWGFRRVTQGDERNAYYHEFFIRDQPFLISSMRRKSSKKKKSGAKRLAYPFQEGYIQPFIHGQHTYTDEAFPSASHAPTHQQHMHEMFDQNDVASTPTKDGYINHTAATRLSSYQTQESAFGNMEHNAHGFINTAMPISFVQKNQLDPFHHNHQTMAFTRDNTTILSSRGPFVNEANLIEIGRAHV